MNIVNPRTRKETILQKESIVGKHRIEVEDYLNYIGYTNYRFVDDGNMTYDLQFHRLNLKVADQIVVSYDFG